MVTVALIVTSPKPNPSSNPNSSPDPCLSQASTKLTFTPKVHLDHLLSHPHLWWAVEYKEWLSTAPFCMSQLIVLGLVMLYNNESDKYFHMNSIVIFYTCLTYFHILLNGAQTMVYFLVSAPMEFIPFDEAGIGPGASDWDLVMETTPDGPSRTYR